MVCRRELTCRQNEGNEMKNEMKTLIEVCGIFSRNPTVSGAGAVEQALLNIASLNKCHKADGSPAPAHSQAVHPHIAAFGGN